jgi:hypothetical protein
MKSLERRPKKKIKKILQKPLTKAPKSIRSSFPRRKKAERMAE